MQRLQVCVTGPTLYLTAILSHRTVVTFRNVHKDKLMPSYSQSFQNLDVMGIEKDRKREDEGGMKRKQNTRTRI